MRSGLTKGPKYPNFFLIGPIYRFAAKQLFIIGWAMNVYKWAVRRINYVMRIRYLINSIFDMEELM